MRRHRSIESEAPGQDSFLDVVANLVGILVILIMVIGVRTRGAWQRTLAASPETNKLQQQVEQADAQLAAVARGNLQLQEEISQIEREALLRRSLRDQLQMWVLQARRALDASQSEHQANEDEARRLEQQILAAAERLQQLEQQAKSLEQQQPAPNILYHYPTPLAKTVFGHEVHYRLMNGRLVYVPLNELLDDLKREAMRKAPQLKMTDQIIETIGPRDGFHMRYSLRRRDLSVDTPSGPVMRQVAELAWFELLADDPALGVPVEQLLNDPSLLKYQLSQWNAQETVITIWTYPDSYAQFRKLKEFFREEGFLTAARPLPEGQPITGSPHGSRSLAQ